MKEYVILPQHGKTLTTFGWFLKRLGLTSKEIEVIMEVVCE